jgi:hypothetical protein
MAKKQVVRDVRGKFEAALRDLREALAFLDKCRADGQSKLNGALRDAHEWLESSARKAAMQGGSDASGIEDALRSLCRSIDCGTIYEAALKSDSDVERDISAELGDSGIACDAACGLRHLIFDEMVTLGLWREPKREGGAS